MTFWTPDTIRTATSGTWLTRPEGTHTSIEGVAIDSRAVKPGQVFLALKGDRFDGHDFLDTAVAAGASLLVVDKPVTLASAGNSAPSIGIIRVPDSRKALLKLASAYRRTLSATRVIAVGGSNGKTTTTRLIQAILATRLRGTCSQKSFNNDVGVPLTILSARESDQYLICEVGSNAPGEIALLAGVVRPDIAVITSIGREHLERLGSLEGVAREEAALLAEVPPGGAAILPHDVPLLADYARATAASGRTVVTFGRDPAADLRLSSFEHFASGASGSDPTPDSIRLGINNRWTFSCPMVGEHNAINALAAVAVARRLGLADADIAAGLASVVVPDMRLQRSTVAGIQIVNDAYNANPDSTLAALRTFAALYAPASRRVVVLGDNLEMGDAGPDAHREIGQAIIDLGCIDLLVAVGPLAALAADAVEAQFGPRRVARLPDLNDGRDRHATRLLRAGDALLVKGSRRMALERLVAALRASNLDAAHAPSSPPAPVPALGLVGQRGPGAGSASDAR